MSLHHHEYVTRFVTSPRYLDLMSLRTVAILEPRNIKEIHSPSDVHLYFKRHAVSKDVLVYLPSNLAVVFVFCAACPPQPDR